MRKTEFSFRDANGNRVKLEAEITTRKGYPEFTISGEMGSSGGQILDYIKPANDAQAKIVEYWKQYHLNGMNAGTPAQQAVLQNCESTNYDERVNYLKFHNLKGEPLTAIEAHGIEAVQNEQTVQLRAVQEKIDKVQGFLTEFKKSQTKHGGSWYVTEYPAVIAVIADPNGGGDFKAAKEGKTRAQFWKQGYGAKLPAKYRRKLDTYVKELEDTKGRIIQERKDTALKMALYDLHPDDGTLYRYGTGWIKRALPETFAEDVQQVIQEIEEGEQQREEEADAPKVVDIADLEEGDPTAEAIEAAAEDDNAAALAMFLELNTDGLDEISCTGYGWGNCLYEAEGTQYYCGTWDEIQEAVKEYIQETAWAFNPEFLAEQTGIPAEAFKVFNEACESGNEGVLAIINKTVGIDQFAEAAESADGWKHFLNSWDGSGDEVEYNGETYFICRS